MYKAAASKTQNICTQQNLKTIEGSEHITIESLIHRYLNKLELQVARRSLSRSTTSDKQSETRGKFSRELERTVSHTSFFNNCIMYISFENYLLIVALTKTGLRCFMCHYCAAVHYVLGQMSN